MPEVEGGPAEAGRKAAQPTASALALVDAQKTVVAWTPAAERLVGFSSREAVGNSIARVLPAFGSASVLTEHHGEDWSGPVVLSHRDGRRVEVHLWASRLMGQDGGTHWLVSATSPATNPPWPVSGVEPESLLTASPIGIAVRDLELRYMWVNDALIRQDGISREKRLGRRLSQVLPGAGAQQVETVMQQVLDSGVGTVDHEYRAWPPMDPRREHLFSTSFFRLDDAQGRVLGVCAMTVDVTDRQRSRERLTMLSEAGTRIGSTLDVMRTGQELADLAVPRIADYVAVDLAETVPLGEESLARLGAISGDIPVFRRAGVASIHEGAPESLWPRGEPVFVPASSPFIKVLTSGSSHLEALLDTSAGTWLDQDPGRAEKAREYGMHSLMIVPIHARGAVLGVAVFVRANDPEPFDESDLLLAEELVTRAALALDNARRYVRERNAALALQRDLLPRRLTGGPALEVASRYLPADMDDGVGGDWFDVIPLSGARVALVVGDVVGHGINAAATMGRLRTAVHTLAKLNLPPDELLAHLDDTIVQLTDEGEDIGAAALGATCLYAVYDSVTRTCTMARAGHPPPAIVSPVGRVTFPDLPPGLPLGIGVGTASFESLELELPEGSVLAFYTDGVIESRDQDLDKGMRRLATALTGAGRQLEELCSAVTEILPTGAPTDDATLLLARTRALSPAQVAHWQLPNEPIAAARARSLAVRQLGEWELDHLAGITELIVSELVTNAVRHGAGPIGLRLIRHQALVCEVSDSSDTAPRLRHARTTDESGRGLFLVAQFSRRRGTRFTAHGKIVWTEQDLTPATSRSAAAH
ncbi:SpoIIE family protein phosphatase [Streptomyces sp. NPDC048448]|uniref:SpoIIE family protein phosphatase n=1 Tax=Streptomyces sp. NPDC048448 TaxID=3365554 RepID=UPI00371530E1